MVDAGMSMIPKMENRSSEKIMLKQTAKKKAASGGELPEAALAAVRSRDTNGGGALKPYDTNGLTNRRSLTD
ncbi:MAG: hypothetical protein QOF09_523 [Alphaproteobacteria bacterium]|jgi:hypothetical protein|nr:hypothetical protein [Alphaproteobacteria bacterium]